MSIQNFDINIAINATQPLGVAGRFIYYLTGSAAGLDQTIKVRAGNTGASFILKPGQSFRLPDDVQPVDTWYLSNNANQAAIMGVVLIGDGTFDDNTISGSVSVVDGEKARTLAGGMFTCGMGVNPSAGNFSQAQLWNPAASGKNLIVTQIETGSNVAMQLRAGFVTVALATDMTAGWASNKKAGMAMGVGQVRYDNPAADAAIASYSRQGFTVASAMGNWPIKGAIVIPPGYGYLIQTTVVTASLLANIEWFEEATQ